MIKLEGYNELNDAKDVDYRCPLSFRQRENRFHFHTLLPDFRVMGQDFTRPSQFSLASISNCRSEARQYQNSHPIHFMMVRVSYINMNIAKYKFGGERGDFSRELDTFNQRSLHPVCNIQKRAIILADTQGKKENRHKRGTSMKNWT